MFYQCVMVSAIFAVVCLGTGIKAMNTNKWNTKAVSVVGSELATLKEVVEQRMPTKLMAIMNNSQPRHEPMSILRSSF